MYDTNWPVQLQRSAKLVQFGIVILSIGSKLQMHFSEHVDAQDSDNLVGTMANDTSSYEQYYCVE